MKKIIEGRRIPIKMWLDEIEESCMEQALNLSSLPFAYKHVALMPDAHTGMGMPIGGVLATEGVVIPNAVGVDIGCGMCAVKTNLHADDLKKRDLEELVMKIKQQIPLGFERHKQPVDKKYLPKGYKINDLPVVKSQSDLLLLQLGTLGGGNHFIEFQKTKENEVWVMIHSGSRNLGHTVAEHYNKEAEQWCKSQNLDFLPQLAFLPIETDLAKKYMAEMNFCIDFAFANRKLMMECVKTLLIQKFPKVKLDEMINIAHNYAAWENHFGKKVIVHRKGATRAFKDELGIIPGSQGTKSYIVKGLGNPESFMSCSHGAGRTMSRRAAQRNLDLNYEIAKMDKKGIVHGIRRKFDLDEASSAYKNIDEVMENQKDLVTPLVELFPMAVVKG